MSPPGKDDLDLPEADTVDASSAAATTNPPTPQGATSPSARAVTVVGPGTQLGRYLIVDELGTGGMATVFRARDPQLRREVAVKVMFPHLAKKPEVARRFQREARAAAGLEHPNILRVYDVGGGRTGDGPDEPPHIVMELVRGETLRELVDRTGPILAEVVACIGAVLCDALAIAHGAGVIHRDVKPGNVMVAEDGRLLLADFGVARIDDDDSLVTRTGALLGTPSYMSPEQAHGDALDGRSDLYSVGATLYQLATGSPPFTGSTAVVVAAISRGDYVPPARRRPQLGAELSRLIASMMSVEPAKRPATAADAAARLRRLVADGGLGEPREELAAFLRDPAGFEAKHTPAIVERLVTRARDALAARALPRAIGLVDRALAIQPDHAGASELAARLAQPASWRRPAAILGGVAGVALLGGGAVYLSTIGGGGGAGDPVAPDAEVIATLVPDAPPVSGTPDGQPLVVVPDARPAAAPPDAPRTRPDAGRRVRPDAREAAIVPDARVAVIVPDARPAPPPDAAPVRAPATASFTLEVDAWCDLSVDKVELGRLVAGKEYEVDAGRHTIACSQGKGMPSWSQTVTLKAGELRALEGSLLADIAVKVAVSSGDKVRVGGTLYKNGATLRRRPGRVKVEILKGDQVVGSKWLSLPAVAACTLEEDPDLDCYP